MTRTITKSNQWVKIRRQDDLKELCINHMDDFDQRIGGDIRFMKQGPISTVIELINPLLDDGESITLLQDNTIEMRITKRSHV